MKRKLYAILLTSILAFNGFTPIVAKAEEASINKEVSQDVAKARKADLDFLLKTLEEKHPDMYNKNEKEVFLEKAKEIEEKLDKMSDFDFVLALSEITALIGDSHTKVSLNTVANQALQMPLGLMQVEEGIMVVTIDEKNKEALGGIVIGINGMSIDDAKKKMMPVISYDNETYLDANFLGYFNIYNILEYTGILSSPKDITLNIKIGEEEKTIKLDAVPIEEMANVKLERLENKIPTKRDKSKIYFKNEIAKDTLYIQYNSCIEDENLPMEDFAKQVQEDIVKNGYKKVIVDLRNNGGGSDGVIMPLMYALEEGIKQDGLSVYALTGSNTFSSALINAVEFKEIGATIVGGNTGGSVDHFGEVGMFELPNSKIQVRYSNKYFDLSTLLKEAEPYDMEAFKPDVYKEQTREDYLQGKDTAIEYILQDTSIKNTPKTNLTREQLAVEIGKDADTRKAGKPLKSLDYTFEDISRISYSTPYIAYANLNSIMVGENEKQFLPSKDVTKGELAVVLYRYTNLLNMPLDSLTKENVEIKNAKSYQQEAIKAIVGTQLLPVENGVFDSSQVVSIKEFENIFSQFKNNIK